ncbi:MAG: hypothetical protein HYY84_13340 [Deltaproteobacteria bacterium]|nr:hypothetical protein [Deltaproteobacteria bacterium]
MISSAVLAMGLVATIGCSKSPTEKKCNDVWEKELASAPKEMRGLLETIKGPTMSLCKTLPVEQVDCLSEVYSQANLQKCADVQKKFEQAIAAR